MPPAKVEKKVETDNRIGSMIQLYRVLMFLQMCRNLVIICSMRDPHPPLTKLLRSHNLSTTKPRQLVFDILTRQDQLTMGELLSLCGSQLDRATLYRTIFLFEKLGVVQRLQIGWKYKIELSNRFQLHHHHLICTRCENVLPLPEDAELEKRLQHLARMKNFFSEDHQIEIRGLCESCRNLKDPEL